MAGREDFPGGAAGGEIAAPLWTALVLFLLNAALVPPHLGWQDSGEFLATTACLGVSHPSGQPLYNLLGAWFLSIPFGTPAWRLGLMSAAASAVSTLLFLFLARRATRLPWTWLVPLGAAWSLSWPWWNQSVTVETYALGLMLCLLVLAALALGEPHRALAVGLTLGLAGVYRPTFILALFVSLPMLFWEWPRGERLKRFVLLAAGWTIGISLPLYLVLRSRALAPVLYSDLSHGPALFRHVLGLGYAKHLGASGEGGALAMGGRFLSVCWKDMTPIGFFLAFFGAGWVAWRWKRAPLFLRVGLVWAALDLGLLLTVPYPALETHQVLWPWVFLGLPAAAALAALRESFGERRWVPWVPLLLAAVALLQALNAGMILRKRADRSAEDYARDVLSVMPQGALYFASTDNDYFPVIGMQQGYGLRKDVTVVSPGDERPGDAVALPDRMRSGAPVVVAKLAPGDHPGWVLNPIGPFWRLGRSPECRVESDRGGAPLVAWKGLELTAFQASPGVAFRGGVVTFHYAWRRPPGKKVDRPAQAVVLLVDENGDYPVPPGGGFYLHDIHPCLNRWFPLHSLDPSKTYAYDRKLFIPSNFPPGRYRVVVALQAEEAPRAGRQEAGGEFYGDGAWQEERQFGTRGTVGGVEKLTAGRGAEERWEPVGGTAPRPWDRLAVVGEVVIQ